MVSPFQKAIFISQLPLGKCIKHLLGINLVKSYKTALSNALYLILGDLHLAQLLSNVLSTFFINILMISNVAKTVLLAHTSMRKLPY